MSQEPLDYLLQDEDNMGKALDDFPQKTTIVAEFYIDPESGNLASMIYDVRYADMVNIHRFAFLTKGQINVQTSLSLATIIQDYIVELKKEDLLDKIEEKPLEGSLEGGVLYLQIYRKLTEIFEKVGTVVYKTLYGPK